MWFSNFSSISKKTSKRKVKIAKFTSRCISTVPMLLKGEKFIDNEDTYDVHSSTGELLHNVSCLSNLNSVDSICSDSYDGFQEWSSMSANAKAEIFDKAIKNLFISKNDLIKAHLDIGVPEWFAGFNFFGSIDNIKHYKSVMTTQPQGMIPIQSPDAAHKTDLSLVVNQPVGPVLSISPWNAPGILCTRSITAPLSAGCSVVSKSSELSPLINYIIVDSFIRAGLPSGAISLVNAKPGTSKEIVEKFISNKYIRKINFTGSTKTGSAIAETAGKFLKPVLLELGGKNCTIIEEDADLKKAVPISIWSGWCHKGQICMSTDMVYLHESIYDKSLGMMKSVASGMFENDTDLKINQRSSRHAEQIKSLVLDALNKGAKLLIGDIDSISDAFIPPMILVDVTPEMDIFTTETFGPVIAVLKYSDIKLAVKQINGLDHGLKCSLWTQNHLKAYKIASFIESGSVHVNKPTIFDESHLPHGGFKQSGYGRFNSTWGINEFTYPKLITFDE